MLGKDAQKTDVMPGATSRLPKSFDEGGCFWGCLIPESPLIDEIAKILQPDFLRTSKSYSNFLLVLDAVTSALALVVWYKYKDRFRKLVSWDTYYLFQLFNNVSWLRLIIPRLCYGLLPYVDSKYLSCEDCGMITNFITILEIELLTHLCIERYVVAKYKFNGWRVHLNYYKLYVTTSMVFSVVYSIAPIFGLGKYVKDFDCETCTYDMILEKDWTRYFVTLVWIFKSIKPALLMIAMVESARQYELLYEKAQKIVDPERYFTNMVYTLVFVNLTCWLPMALVRGFVLHGQLTTDVKIPNSLLVHAAPIFYEMSPMLSLMIIFLGAQKLPLNNQQNPVEDAPENGAEGVSEQKADNEVEGKIKEAVEKNDKEK